MKLLLIIKNVKVGKLKFVAPNSEMKPLATTTIYVSVDDELCGYVTFTDHVRPEAKETMNTLKALGVKKINDANWGSRKDCSTSS